MAASKRHRRFELQRIAVETVSEDRIKVAEHVEETS
jgi:hypothetical protein